ncbi:MAG TPA: ABC transporter ATP-binding protein [Dehalococcoidia bacterium]|nr:ABC transporter ATP-binding protein [Dehalococcoidia bacterium]
MKQVVFAWFVVAMTAVTTMIMPQLLRWAVDTGLKPNYPGIGVTITRPVTAADEQILVDNAASLQVGQRFRLGDEVLEVKAIDGNTVTVDRGNLRDHAAGTELARARPEYAGKTETLLLAAGAILGVALLRGVFTYWMQFLGEWLSQHVAYDLRNKIYDRLQRQSYAYHDKQQTGQLMSRATQDVESTRMFIQLGALRLLDMILRIVVAVAFMVTSNLVLTLVAWSLMPLVAWQSIRIQLKSRRLWMGVQEQLGRLTTVLQENLSGVRVVKAFSREPYEDEKFRREAEELFNWNIRQNRIQAQSNPFYQAAAMLSQVIVLWVGAVMITNGDLSPGELIAFLSYLTLMIMPMRMLGFIVQMFARAGASGERIFEILDAESAVKEKPDAIELRDIRGDVRFENVSFSYDAVSPVLRDVSFEVPAGKVVALLGPTGSGKTTIVNLLPRFYDVTGGRITIDGIDVRDVTLTSLRANIGIIQQDVFLFSATIRDNIAYGAVDATQEQIIEAAKIARIHDFIMSLPEGYDTWVGERGITLSGGQKQRISIARTLLLDPKILILDDSTSSVDTQTEYLIQQALAAVMKGRTTLVIAQRLRTVKNADQILVMRGGTIAERGTHEELIALDGLYREIYDLELRDQEEALKRFSGSALTGSQPVDGSAG